MAPAVQESHLQPYPLYNTTFALYRVSPLYTGTNNPLDNPVLQQHARRFRDTLAGDVLRGVRVGLAAEDNVLARIGALQSVTWQVLVEQDLWNMDEETRMGTAMGIGASKGILIQISYEKMIYRALLLHGGEEDLASRQEGFQHFPLLLTRMPASLRDTLTDFLSKTFDARVAVLHLSSSYLTTIFEKYMSDCCMGEEGEEMSLLESSRTLRKVVKDVQILVGFDFPTTNSLQTIEFHIAQDDIPRLVQKGKLKNLGSPFMNAFSSFVEAHLALDMGHERVRVLRIACGAFVLGAEGRIKLTESLSVDSLQRWAMWNLVNALVGISKNGKMSSGLDAS